MYSSRTEGAPLIQDAVYTEESKQVFEILGWYSSHAINHQYYFLFLYLLEVWYWQ